MVPELGSGFLGLGFRLFVGGRFKVSGLMLGLRVFRARLLSFCVFGIWVLGCRVQG